MAINKFSYAAGRIKRGVNYKVWKDGFHPIELTDNKMMDQKLEYIHFNPVEEEYVRMPEDWVYSSAGYYLNNMDAKVKLTRIE